MKRILLPLVAALGIMGCSGKSAPEPKAESVHLTFPVIVTEADALDNQVMFERAVMARVSMQSLFPLCNAPHKGVCIKMETQRSEQPFGIDSLDVSYYDGSRRVLDASYPVKIKKEQGGRSFFVTLMPADDITGVSSEAREDAKQLSNTRPCRI